MIIKLTRQFVAGYSDSYRENCILANQGSPGGRKTKGGLNANGQQGGLGLHSTRDKNKALLAKWVWHYNQEKNVLWRKLIKEKYGSSTYLY